MRAKLSEEDIKSLKYQCRAGYVVSILFFITGSFVIFGLYYINDINSLSEAVLLFLTILTISFLIAFFMMNKYITDINNKEKILEVKIIQAKELNLHYSYDFSQPESRRQVLTLYINTAKDLQRRVSLRKTYLR